MPFQQICAFNGKKNARSGFDFIQSRGLMKSSKNIMSVFPVRWSAGSIQVTDRASCGVRTFASIVAETLRYFDGERLVLISSVVMPNHVHAVFVQNTGWPLEKLLRSWKSFTSRK